MKDDLELDVRGKEELKKEIYKKAASYTPEWRFDEELPDAGTALALLYSEMLENTIRKLNRVPQKNKICFFNLLGTRQRSASPARGYITFHLVNEEVEGSYVKKGTKLTAAGRKGETVVFETIEDIYVTPASISDIYTSFPVQDKFYCVYEKEEDSVPQNIFLFDTSSENLQKHELYLYQSDMFHIIHSAWIYLKINGNKNIENLLEALTEEENVEISYYSEKGYISFQKRKYENGQLMLYKEKNQPAFAMCEEETNYCIRIIFKNGHQFRNMAFRSITLRSESETIPDFIYGNDLEQNLREFLPFGEQPVPYMEFYIASDEVFGKKGAFIHVSFDVDYVITSLESSEIPSDINWKPIMKRSDIKADEEYDISIEEVIWEYYNGQGYKRLFENEQYGAVFSVKDGISQKQVSLHFQCPMDISPFLVNSSITYSIRARVIKVNNFYKMRGHYISPKIRFLKLRYEYHKDSIMPQKLVLMNNMEKKSYFANTLREEKEDIYPVQVRNEKQLCMYFGFQQPLLEGPIKILYKMEDSYEKAPSGVRYEYYSKGRWKALNHVDGTDHFRKTGILTLMGQTDFTKLLLFGKERYWLRIADLETRYSQSEKIECLPFINAIYLNTTPIMETETMEEESFFIPFNQNEVMIELGRSNIYQLELWTNEKKRISHLEMEELKKEKRIEFDYFDNGEVDKIWVRWIETQQFTPKNPRERYYILNRIEGKIYFPNGRNGMTAPYDEEMSVKVRYSVNGGEEGNLPPHSIESLETAIGFISEVTNYTATAGGTAQETVQEAVNRTAAWLRHGERAVTARDYEDLAREACSNIIKVKCFSNYNIFGEKEYGCITLVILQKDFEEGRSYFEGVKMQVWNYITERMSTYIYTAKKMQVIEPRFLEIDITAELLVEDYNQVFETRREAEQKISEFLHPVTGNFNRKGFEIGVLPNETQILNILQNIHTVRGVRGLKVTVFENSKGERQETDILNRQEKRYMLGLNGRHTIHIQVE